MKAAFFFGLVLLGVFHIDAKHAKRKSASSSGKETATQAKKPAEYGASEPVTGGLVFPGFAVRIPVVNFGVLGRMKQQIENIMKAKNDHGLADRESGYAGKTKTRTKTSNSTHGPFKTFTVTTETVTEGNKTVNPKVISKLIKSVTTVDKTKLPAEGEKGAMLPLSLGSFGLESGDLAPMGKKCIRSGDCEDYEFCTSGACTKHFQPGSSCTQKDACASKGGYRCTWGRCVVNSYKGSAGTFCDSDSECHGKSHEELDCLRQPDLSMLASVCTPKLNHGSTCGRAGIFDLFKHDDELNSRCKSGLLCKAVGYFGRKVCIPPFSDGSSEKTNEVEAENEGSGSGDSDEQEEKKGGKKHKVDMKMLF